MLQSTKNYKSFASSFIIIRMGVVFRAECNTPLRGVGKKQNVNFNQYIFFKNDKIVGLESNNLPEIYEIVDFSIPQIQSKIDMGYKIFKSSPQVLY